MLQRKFLAKLLLLAGVGLFASALYEAQAIGDTPKLNMCCRHAFVTPAFGPNDVMFDATDCGYRRSRISGPLMCTDLGFCNGQIIDMINGPMCFSCSFQVCRPNFNVAFLTLNDYVTSCSDTSGLAPGCLCVASLFTMYTAIVPDCGGNTCPF